MSTRPTYEELEHRIEKLEKEVERYKQAEEALKGSAEYFRLHSDLANTFIRLPPSEFDKVIETLLERIVEFFGVDRGTLIYWPESDASSRKIYSWKREGVEPYHPPAAPEEYPYLAERVMNGEIFSFSSIDDLPSEAQAEKDLYLSDGTKSEIILPMRVEGEFLGVLIISSFRTEKIWSHDLVQQLQLIGQTFTYSLERTHSDEVLRESEDKLKAIFENVNDEIVYLDGQGIVIDANNRVEDIFGFKPEEVIGKNITELQFCRPEGMKNLMKQFSRGLSKGIRSFLIEFEGMRKDGTEIFIEASTSAIKKDGEIKNILSVIRDITKRKRLEAQLQQANKMEAIGTLAGGIAHEFNNILGIIVGNTELAMDGVPERNPAHYNLEEILTASLRARDVVRQILAFSRHSELGFKPVLFGPIVMDSLKLLRASIPSSIEIRQNIACEKDTVLADPTQINQVLINLCANAAHAMRDDGGVLEVGLENVELNVKDVSQYHDLAPGGYLRLSVTDTGHGIGPDIVGRIFDPYFTTKEVGEGSGMGLAVVHGIVKNHGGEITVHSAPGKGTTFQVLFPVIEDRVKPQVESSKAPLLKGNERILFVDDEEGLVFAAENYLEDLGYEVITERNPVKALGIFRETPEAFDLVITDMTMPDMTGDRLAKELMQIRPDIPVILCTGFCERITEEKAKGMGIKAYVMKPALVHEMATTIRLVLDQGREKAPAAKRILVVDDEVQMRSMLRQMLETSGYDVLEAPDGKVALRICREKHPDLMITDLIMPEKEGIETIMEIRRDFPEVKVIAISGGGQIDPEAYLALARKLGASQTLAKPFKREELLKMVKELL